MSYSMLKSGTYIRGIASDLVGGKLNLTSAAVYDITSAFAVWYIKKYKKNPSEIKAAVGRDSRITGEAIAGTVMKALSDAGIAVLDCGFASTPALFT